MSTFDNWKSREPEDADARKPTAGDEEPAEPFNELLPCAKCGALPKDCIWQCRRCGAIAEAIPYPAIGCQCVAATYVCDVCLWGNN